MKYFGREDFKEGEHYPSGLHWGYITSWAVKPAYLEYFCCACIRPRYKDRQERRLIVIAFVTWPAAPMRAEFGWWLRRRFIFVWYKEPTYGS